MIRKFARDVRGNYMVLTAAAIVPIMGALALAVDYAEMSRQRQEVLNALDAAGIATARYIAQGATDEQAKTYGEDFFEANLSSVSPSNAKLTIVLPKENTGGGTLKMSAQMKYSPYFFPTFAALLGNAESNEKLDFNAVSEVRLKNTLEVALVLDNSGSMDYTGTGSGKKRLTLLKDAAKQLVTTIAAEGEQMKQIAKPVQFGVVPFAASVNVGSGNKNASWMDTDGISPIHHENFDWSTMTGNKKVQISGGVYYKKGNDWGTQENQKVTRFTLFDDIQRITGYTSVKTGSEWKCIKKSYYYGGCSQYGWVDVYEDQPVYGTYASWQGCVEARPYPYNVNDTTPSSSTPATMFVPMFAPDETDNKDGSNRRAENNWWSDVTNSSSNSTRQSYMPKYFSVAAYGTSAAGSGDGPNASCTTTAITALTDVTNATGKKTITDAIDAMAANGSTNVPEGMAWGWRVVSSAAPFSEGRAETERGNDKVVIVLTDGANTYYTPSSLGYNDLAGNKSVYSSYGYTGKGYDGTSTTRLFMNTSTAISKTDYSNSNYTSALNEQFTALCANAKEAGLIVMTVSLDLSTSDTTEKAQIDALKACSSDSRFRKGSDGKPAKLYWNATGSSLSNDFKEIADELSNLRIVG